MVGGSCWWVVAFFLAFLLLLGGSGISKNLWNGGTRLVFVFFNKGLVLLLLGTFLLVLGTKKKSSNQPLLCFGSNHQHLSTTSCRCRCFVEKLAKKGPKGLKGPFEKVRPESLAVGSWSVHGPRLFFPPGRNFCLSRKKKS